MRLWVQDATVGMQQVNRFRPTFVGALRSRDGQVVLEGRFDLSPFGVFAMGTVVAVLAGVLIGLVTGDPPRVFPAIVAAVVVLSVVFSRRQYRDDIAFMRQTLEGALRWAPNMPPQTSSGAARTS